MAFGINWLSFVWKNILGVGRCQLLVFFFFFWLEHWAWKEQVALKANLNLVTHVKEGKTPICLPNIVWIRTTANMLSGTFKIKNKEYPFSFLVQMSKVVFNTPKKKKKKGKRSSWKKRKSRPKSSHYYALSQSLWPKQCGSEVCRQALKIGNLCAHVWRAYAHYPFGSFWKWKLNDLVFSYHQLFLFCTVWWWVHFSWSRLIYASLCICYEFRIWLMFVRGLFHGWVNVEYYYHVDRDYCKDSTPQRHGLGRQVSWTCSRCMTNDWNGYYTLLTNTSNYEFNGSVITSQFIFLIETKCMYISCGDACAFSCSLKLAISKLNCKL